MLFLMRHKLFKLQVPFLDDVRSWTVQSWQHFVVSLGAYVKGIEICNKAP